MTIFFSGLVGADLSISAADSLQWIKSDQTLEFANLGLLGWANFFADPDRIFMSLKIQKKNTLKKYVPTIYISMAVMLRIAYQMLRIWVLL